MEEDKGCNQPASQTHIHLTAESEDFLLPPAFSVDFILQASRQPSTELSLQ